MTHEQLLHDRADCIYELGEARRTWLSERALSGFATTEGIDPLLDELLDINQALTHEGIADYD